MKGELDRYESDIEELFTLAPRTRAVIYLHHIEGLPFASIAEALGLSEENARTIASRGRRDLQHQHRAERP